MQKIARLFPRFLLPQFLILSQLKATPQSEEVIRHNFLACFDEEDDSAGDGVDRLLHLS